MDKIKMKERPIIFQPKSVKGTLKGDKTQTRRLVKLKTIPIEYVTHICKDGSGKGFIAWIISNESKDKTQAEMDKLTVERYPNNEGFPCPYGEIGDRLWVRESFYACGTWVKNGLTKNGKQKWKFKDLTVKYKYFDNPPKYIHKGRNNELGWYKRPALFMPRKAARLILEITDRRVERLQNITAHDAIAEGIFWSDHHQGYVVDEDGSCFYKNDPTESYYKLWVIIHGSKSWDENSFVWVVQYKKI